MRRTSSGWPPSPRRPLTRSPGCTSPSTRRTPPPEGSALAAARHGLLLLPVVEAGRGEAGAGRGDEAAFLQFRAVVGRVRVGDDLAGVVALAERVADEFVEVELLGPGDLDDAVHRRPDGDIRDGAGH